MKRSSASSQLVRGLGVWAAIAVVVSDVIGSGIFLVTSDMARAVGSAVMVFAAWIVGGIIVLCGAFCFAELGAALPQAGGRYVYPRAYLGLSFWLDDFGLTAAGGHGDTCRWIPAVHQLSVSDCRRAIVQTAHFENLLANGLGK